MNNSNLDKDLQTAFLNKERLTRPLSDKEMEMAESINIDVEGIIKSRKNVIGFSSFKNLIRSQNISIQSLSSMAATLVIGIFIGGQFLGTDDNFINPTQETKTIIGQSDIRTKNFTALSADSSNDISSKIQEMSPGESLTIRLDENLKMTFLIKEEKIKETDNCHILTISLGGSTSSLIDNIKACKEMTFSGPSWVFSDVQK
jgi:hypothetical protein